MRFGPEFNKNEVFSKNDIQTNDTVNVWDGKFKIPFDDGYVGATF